MPMIRKPNDGDARMRQMLRMLGRLAFGVSLREQRLAEERRRETYIQAVTIQTTPKK